MGRGSCGARPWLAASATARRRRVAVAAARPAASSTTARSAGATWSAPAASSGCAWMPMRSTRPSCSRAEHSCAIPSVACRAWAHSTHPVRTTSAEAQKFFEQGLSFGYAFNHPEAVRSFERAAQLDPQVAMAYWGIALALGSNINAEIDADRECSAHEAVQKARRFAAAGPERERAYIEALARRYSVSKPADRKALDLDYKRAMGDVVRRYPDDLDAATLYAEAAMVLRPWRLWTAQGTPEDGTLEIVSVLESVLRRDPDHIGAIHYYIHAVEASPHPEWALPYAP